MEVFSLDQTDMVTVIEAVQWDFEPGLVVPEVHEVCDETLCLRWSENSTSPLANKVVKSEFTADIDARIDEVFSIYESRSKSFSWWIGPNSRPVDLRNRLEPIRKALGFQQWDFAGHSTGGMLGLMYAVRHPESLSSLIIVGAAPSKDYASQPDCIYHPEHPLFERMQALRGL